MMFVFAKMAESSEPSGWPVHLMHQTEAAFVITALVCTALAIVWACIGVSSSIGAQAVRGVIAFAGGVSASFGLIMPFELAPFFFHSKGEIMLATMTLNLAYLPVAGLFMVMFATLMRPARA
jgi:uncharacterized membrane protein (DUF2068 family)